MTASQIISALTIYLFLPLTGLLWFLQLKKQIRKENMPNPPTIELFIIFSTYGGLLLVILTAFFWFWSGMASYGLSYSIFIAPIIMGIIAYRNRQTRITSKYHNWAFLSGLLYFVFVPITFIALLLFSE